MDQQNNLNDIAEENLLNFANIVHNLMLTQEKIDNKENYDFNTDNLDKKKLYIINKIININMAVRNIIHNDCVYVKKSLIHGNGVFAKYNIKKNSIITIYPIDSIYYTNNLEEKNLYFLEKNFFDCINNKNYMIGINKDIEIYGNQNNISNNTVIGHIINDSVSFTIDNENIDDISLKNIICKYVLTSNNNAIMKSNADKTLYYIIATKDINEGDEILMSYQPKYWLDNKKLYKRFETFLINDIKFKQFFLNIGFQKLCGSSNNTEILQYLS